MDVAEFEMLLQENRETIEAIFGDLIRPPAPPKPFGGFPGLDPIYRAVLDQPNDPGSGARLSFAVSLAEKDPAGETKIRRFKGLAYSGAVVDTFWTRLVIELSGIKLPKRPIPVLLEHSTMARIGKSAKGGGFSNTDRGLEIEGELLRNEIAQGVVDDADDGFPWEMSIYIKPAPGRGVEFVEEGKTATVNGEEVVGPLYIYRKSILREASFTVLGADESTTARVLSEARASGKGRFPMEGTTDGEVKKLVEEAVAKALSEAKLAAETERKEALEKAATDVQAAERARTAAILEACGDSLGELAAKHIKEGTKLEDALLEINKALHDARTPEQRKLDGLGDLHGGPAGPPPKDESGNKKEGEEKKDEDWDKLTAAQKEEYQNDPKNHEVWMRNKHLVSGIPSS